MNSKVNSHASLLGWSFPVDTMLFVARVCISAVFLYSGTTKLIFWPKVVEEFVGLNLPYSTVLASATITVQLIGGLAYLVGHWFTLASIALGGFTVVATLIAHPFWQLEGQDFQFQLITALEHLAIVGGFAGLLVVGPGKYAISPTEVSK